MLYDLFQKHYPQMIGQILVLNYGWIHAGIWRIIRSTLPEHVCQKIIFCSCREELQNYISPDAIPQGKNIIVDKISLFRIWRYGLVTS